MKFCLHGSARRSQKTKKTQEHKNGILNLSWAINKKCREGNFTYIGPNSNPDPNAKQTDTNFN